MVKQHNIAIIGGGMSGLLTACLLQQNKHQVVVFERNAMNSITAASTRTVTLSAKTRDIAAKCGIWQRLNQADIGQVEFIDIYDASDNVTMRFDAASVDAAAMGFVVYNHQFLKTAMDIFLQNGGIINDNVSPEIDSVHTCVSHNGSNVQFDAIIIADGVASNIAKSVGFSFLSHNYNQSALMFNVRHDNAHHYVAAEKFMPNGPFALLPLPNQNESCVIWTNSTVVSNKLTSLDDGLFNDIASEYTPKFYGRLHRISDVKLYNLQTHVATSRRKNKTFLLGGALFSMHPLAGQGFNLIARDIEFFTDKISQLSIDELCKYSTFTGRLPDNALMLSGVHCIASLFGNKSLAIKAARHVGMKMIDSFDLVKNATIMQAMGYGFA